MFANTLSLSVLANSPLCSGSEPLEVSLSIHFKATFTPKSLLSVILAKALFVRGARGYLQG